MSQNFNNPQVHTQSWYVACASARVRPGRILTITLFGRSICIYRDSNNTAHALDARCPHLGADLGKGRIIGDRIQCAFHHWEFDCAGQCRLAPGLAEAPKRQTHSYPVEERWGYLWIWNGPEALFDLPAMPDNLRAVRMPSQTLRCHPHVMIGNGLDVSHFSALHGMKLVTSAYAETPPFGVEVTLEGCPVSARMRWLTGTTCRNLRATFATIGGNIATVRIQAPIEFAMLFTGNVTEAGHCTTHTIAFLPRRIFPDMARALMSVYVLLHDDRWILDDIDFRPGFVETDEPFRLFVDTINQMKTW